MDYRSHPQNPRPTTSVGRVEPPNHPATVSWADSSPSAPAAMSVMRWWHRIVGSRRTARILPLHQSHEATVASGVDDAAA
jgi:hypothetical protein